jgi:MarR family transcriptional regulator, organic hydroperoxide resistance regulator
MHIESHHSLNRIFATTARRHYQVLHDRLSGHHVFPGQPPLLRALLMKDGQSQKELAKDLQIAPATLTVMLRRMEKHGLVSRRQDAADQRVSRVFLTERGMEAHVAVREALIQMEDLSFRNFTDNEKDEFRILLTKMLTNLSSE